MRPLLLSRACATTRTMLTFGPEAERGAGSVAREDAKRFGCAYPWSDRVQRPAASKPPTRPVPAGVAGVPVFLPLLIARSCSCYSQPPPSRETPATCQRLVAGLSPTALAGLAPPVNPPPASSLSRKCTSQPAPAPACNFVPLLLPSSPSRDPTPPPRGFPGLPASGFLLCGRRGVRLFPAY